MSCPRSKAILLRSLAIAALLIFAVVGTAHGQRSHPILCRGGSDLKFTYVPFSNASAEPQVWVDFRRSEHQAGERRWELRGRLRPGECSSPDQPIASNEPSRLLVPVGRDEFTIVWGRGEVKPSPRHIEVLLDDDAFQVFHVYDDGRGTFIVTRVGESLFAR